MPTANYFNLGDNVLVKDDDLGINRYIRITAFKRNILKPYQYMLSLAETPSRDLETQLLVNQDEIRRKIRAKR